MSFPVLSPLGDTPRKVSAAVNYLLTRPASTATATPLDFGAVGDGVSDDGAALLAALESGRLIDGLGKTYAISVPITPTSLAGFQNAKLVWLNTTAMSAQQFMISITELNNWFLDNIWFDLGTVAATGSVDDSSRGGLSVGVASGHELTYFNAQISVTRCRVTGYGNGTGLKIRNCDRGSVTGNFVYGRRVAATSGDPPNDCQDGLDITRCRNMTVSGNVVYDLQSLIGGVYIPRFSRGIVVTSTSNSSFTDNVINTIDQGFDFSGGTDLDGNVGNTISSNAVSDCYSFGIKLANCARHNNVIGNNIARYGLAGITLSGLTSSSDPVSLATQDNLIANNYIYDPAVNATFGASCNGIRIILSSAGNTSYPANCRFVANTVRADGLNYGFHSEVDENGNRFLLNDTSGATNDYGSSTATGITTSNWKTL